ncbi:MAG: phosphohistidine phosphatase SixA [Gammaproteobacteria bacterium]
MKLYLARHGEYQTENLNSLTPLGKQHIMRMASFLKPLNIKLSTIFHSGKLRAQQTAELLADAFHCDGQPVARNGIDPTDEIPAIYDEISHWDEDTLLVGHLPFMGKLTSKLITGDENHDIVMFYPGTLVCLEKTGSGYWSIDWVIRPELV